MKKKVLISGAILLLLAALFCLYMESRYVNIGSVDINMTAEEMVAERPDIAVSEKDLALEAYVLSLPEVQALVEQTKTENSDDLKNRGGSLGGSCLAAEELYSGRLERWRAVCFTGQHHLCGLFA